uniref:Uncharacterized protein n=1 Tax=Rhipicephalus zambeziensis TaxID=60191 RepID=A0A224YCE5_9ACAR
MDNKQERGEIHARAGGLCTKGREAEILSLFRSSQPAVQEPADAWSTGIRGLSLLFHSEKKKKKLFFFPFSFPLFLTFFLLWTGNLSVYNRDKHKKKKKTKTKPQGSTK